MTTVHCSRALAAAALALLAAGCGSKGGDEAAAVVGGYEGTAVDFFQKYRIVQNGGAPIVETRQVTASSPAGFTRRYYTGSNAGYLEYDLSVEGGALGFSAFRQHSAAGAVQSTTTYAPPLLLLPADLTPGAVTSRVTTATTGSTTSTQTRVVTVDGIESVSVPAGTFQALKVTTQLTSSDGPASTFVTWWAKGLGRVRIDSTTDFATPLVVLTELTEHGTGPLPIVTPDGTYRVTAVRCNGTAAPSPLADLITGGSTLGLTVAGAVQSTTWGDVGCTITQPGRAVYPVIGNVTITPSGPFACAPSAAACAGLSDALFGQQVCGQTDLAAKRYTFSPTSTAVGGTIMLTRQGGEECAAVGATDPMSLVLTRQP